MKSLLALVVLALLACNRRDDGPTREEVHLATKPAAPAAVLPGPSAGDEVTAMAVSGFLRIEDAQGRREEPLPASPLHHGEFPEGCYASADGSVYAVGKQYTGVDGPDDGVVWKRAADGTWSTVLRLEREQLASVVGIAPDDIVVAGSFGYSWWDGKTWTRHDTPEDFVHVWSDGKTIYGTDFAMTTTFEIVRGERRPAPKSHHSWRDDKYVCARGSTHYRVFDKSAPIGKVTLSPAEAAQIRDEVKQIEAHPENVRPVAP